MAKQKQSKFKKFYKNVKEEVVSTGKQIGQGLKEGGRAVGEAAYQGVQASKEGWREAKKLAKKTGEEIEYQRGSMVKLSRGVSNMTAPIESELLSSLPINTRISSARQSLIRLLNMKGEKGVMTRDISNIANYYHLSYRDVFMMFVALIEVKREREMAEARVNISREREFAGMRNEDERDEEDFEEEDEEEQREERREMHERRSREKPQTKREKLREKRRRHLENARRLKHFAKLKRKPFINKQSIYTKPFDPLDVLTLSMKNNTGNKGGSYMDALGMI